MPWNYSTFLVDGYGLHVAGCRWFTEFQKSERVLIVGAEHRVHHLPNGHHPDQSNDADRKT